MSVNESHLTSAPALLSVRDVSVHFGGVAALRGVSLDLGVGDVLGLVGPNGAGKTTLMNAISGLVRPSSGTIYYGDDRAELSRLPGSRRMALGISRTFQHSRLLAGMKVIDQLMCGAYTTTKYSALSMLTRSRSFARAERQIGDRARELLSELGLSNAEHADVGALPSPHRRLVDLGRALMSQPRVLLLDEIAAGMTEDEKMRVIDVVRRRNVDDNLSLIVIEHDLSFVRTLCAKLTVMAQGSVLNHGETSTVLGDPEVLRAYVGE